MPKPIASAACVHSAVIEPIPIVYTHGCSPTSRKALALMITVNAIARPESAGNA